MEDNIRAIVTLGLPKSEQDKMVHERLEELNLSHLASKRLVIEMRKEGDQDNEGFGFET